MPRIARMVVPDQKTVYHVMSRTALDGYPFSDIEKDRLVDIIKHLSRIYFADVLGYCIMGNHFHLLIQMYPETTISDEEGEEKGQANYALFSLGFGLADSAHIAFAEAGKAKFITCDDKLMKKCRKHTINTWCGNPVQFCAEEDLR
uniref:Transposase IS200-like domain-containing protein n=2 Tax=Desulfobacterium TaxID=2295 RepID=E1YJV0_9BACT|nr:hypothetical protein N47_E50660 [uncultured Desulfobacterium sp.]